MASESTGPASSESPARWLSQGLEDLVHHLGERSAVPDDGYDFDIAIVGSGYGGSMAAAELAGRIDRSTGKRVRICILERGREYLSGMFPVSEAQLPGHLRIAPTQASSLRGKAEGLFDLRLGPDVSALVANGLGGGSLINAGVMASPARDVLESSAWPADLRVRGALDKYYVDAQKALGIGEVFPRFNQVNAPAKTVALKQLDPKAFEYTPLSIALDGGRNQAGIELKPCLRCGDCATGCNHRAKNSLDQNRLVIARRQGVKIYCGATVVSIAQSAGRAGWKLRIVHTDLSVRARNVACELAARRVILAAGSFGSTELLMRSATPALHFSDKLGERFSTNGDLLAVAYDQKKRVNAVASESVPCDRRAIGPTITGMLDRRSRDERIVIEEFAIPAALRRLFEESFTLAHTFQTIARADPDGSHRAGRGGRDPCAVSLRAIERTQVFGIMGHDGAAGVMQHDASGVDVDTEGATWVKWSELRPESGTTVFDEQVGVLETLAAASSAGGTIIPNPIWRLLPEELSSIAKIPRGPALTVHPLGGCAMADHAGAGVVNQYGEVFDGADATSVHDGLVVLDGSIVPCSLGINPALTIAAISLRAVESLGARWLGDADPHAQETIAPIPPLRQIARAPRIPTTISILERVTGEVDIVLADGTTQKRCVELTIEFERQSLRRLSRLMKRRLTMGPRSRIRMFTPECWEELWRSGASEREFDKCATFIAPLTGRMALLDREPSTPVLRALRALGAWWLNRGMRDLWQRHFSNRSSRRQPGNRPAVSLWQQRRTFWNFASHAGEARLFLYDIEVGEPVAGLNPPAKAAQHAELYAQPFAGGKIRTVKRLTYSLAANPWRQLSEMDIKEFPNQVAGKRPFRLQLEPKYYARHHKHLLQIQAQPDHATALFEMASFLLCILRIVLTTHIWSFRFPDAPDERKECHFTDTPDGRNKCRLPGSIPGLPEPSTTLLEVGKRPDGNPLNILLTRYLYPPEGEGLHPPQEEDQRKRRPVVLIHGFSANGTTFAHPALRPGLADFLWSSKRDVWILDLRTSSGLPSALDSWAFEQVAADIPRAFHHIKKTTGADRIDVVAQCMGAAMLSMAILGDGPLDSSGNLSVRGQQEFLGSVGNVVLSQISPMIVFTAANIFRAYAVSYIQNAFGTAWFDLRPDGGLRSQLLDRLLSSVPYSDVEFVLENPRVPWQRTPFAGTRHRMDAWFGRVFNLANVSPDVLAHIDDLFGPINLHTTFQTIHFARCGIICSRQGRNDYISPERLQRWRDIPSLSIHGEMNGLADVATLTRMRSLMESMHLSNHRSFIVPGFGHHDCMIGKRAPAVVFPKIAAFLDDPVGFMSEPASMTGRGRARNDAASGPVADAPWLGPIVGEPSAPGRWPIAVAADPKLGKPSAILVVPMKIEAQRWVADEVQTLRSHEVRQALACCAGRNEGIQWYRAEIEWPDAESVMVLLVYDQPSIIRRAPYYGERLTSSLAGPKLDFDSRLASLAAPGMAASDPGLANILNPDVRPAAIATVLEQRALVQSFLDQCPEQEYESALMQRPATATPLRNALCFVVGSCQYPAGPLDQDLAARSYGRLRTVLEPHDRGVQPEFLVQVGDQVYIDATAGLMDPAVRDDRYELPYEKFMRTPEVRAVLKRVPCFALLDDHEIKDNWEPTAQPPSYPGASDRIAELDEQRVRGRAAYVKFQRVLNPLDYLRQDSVWYRKAVRDFRFFFADTRTERTSRTVTRIGDARIMSDAQFEALLNWLTEHTLSGKPVFVVSPSILLPRRRLSASSEAAALRSDAWDGFPGSLQRLLAHIARERLSNIVFLSGDEHHSCLATVRLTVLPAEPTEPVGPPVITHSIHSSALYAPFVFANGEPEDLAGTETFHFDDSMVPGSRIKCDVHTQFIDTATGTFAVIECFGGAGTCSIQCNFDSAARVEKIRFEVDCPSATDDSTGTREHEARTGLDAL